MGVYRAAVVTESGQNIIAQALANEQPLIFTSAKTSRYAYPLGTNIPALTGLQDVVQSVMPFDSKVINGNVAQVSVRFDNDEIDQVYRIETIGLYAKIEGGTETLFSVTQAITPDEMPIHSDVSPSAYIYNIQHTVQNASQITLTVNPTGTATVQDIMDIEQPEFDDSGTVSGIDSFPAFLNKTKSKMNIFQWYRDFKAGMQFVLHAGQIVNNCVSSDADKPLAAAQGKALQDQLTKLYSDLSVSQGLFTDVADIVSDSNLYYAKIGPHLIYITGWLEIATGNYDASYQVFKMDEYKAEINTILHAVDANALTSPIFPMYINNGTNIVNLKLKQAINTKLTLQITGFVVV